MRLVARAPNDTCGPVYCAGTNNTNDNSYFCGDLRLGPKQLPTEIPLSSEILGYDRLGGLCPGAFLQKWWNSTSAGYIYPPQNGFQLNTANQPIDGNQTLAVGTRLDRFGSEYGAFLAPAGAPFSERAIPPSNLNTPADPSYPYNYHVYEVVQSFDVLSGPIAGTRLIFDWLWNAIGNWFHVLSMVRAARARYSVSNLLQYPSSGTDVFLMWCRSQADQSV